MSENQWKKPRDIGGEVQWKHGLIWRDVYFQVSANTIYLYPRSRKHENQVLAKISLTQVDEVSETRRKFSKKSFQIVLKTGAVEQFKCPEKEGVLKVQQWIDNLSHAMKFWMDREKQKKHGRPRRVTLEGPDETLEGLDGKKHRVFFTLWNGEMIGLLVSDSATFTDAYTRLFSFACEPSKCSVCKIRHQSCGLWAVDTSGTGRRVGQDESLHALDKEGNCLFVMEHHQKLLVVHFRDFSYEVFPVPATITAKEILKLEVIASKLNELSCFDPGLFLRYESGDEVQFCMNDNPICYQKDGRIVARSKLIRINSVKKSDHEKIAEIRWKLYLKRYQEKKVSDLLTKSHVDHLKKTFNEDEELCFYDDHFALNNDVMHPRLQDEQRLSDDGHYGNSYYSHCNSDDRGKGNDIDNGDNVRNVDDISYDIRDNRGNGDDIVYDIRDDRGNGDDIGYDISKNSEILPGDCSAKNIIPGGVISQNDTGLSQFDCCDDNQNETEKAGNYTVAKENKNERRMSDDAGGDLTARSDLLDCQVSQDATDVDLFDSVKNNNDTINSLETTNKKNTECENFTCENNSFVEPSENQTVVCLSDNKTVALRPSPKTIESNQTKDNLHPSIAPSEFISPGRKILHHSMSERLVDKKLHQPRHAHANAFGIRRSLSDSNIRYSFTGTTDTRDSPIETCDKQLISRVSSSLSESDLLNEDEVLRVTDVHLPIDSDDDSDVDRKKGETDLCKLTGPTWTFAKKVEECIRKILAVKNDIVKVEKLISEELCKVLYELLEHGLKKSFFGISFFSGTNVWSICQIICKITSVGVKEIERIKGDSIEQKFHLFIYECIRHKHLSRWFEVLSSQDVQKKIMNFYEPRAVVLEPEHSKAMEHLKIHLDGLLELKLKGLTARRSKEESALLLSYE